MYEAQSARWLMPGPGGKTTAGSTSTAAVDLSAHLGQNVMFTLDQPAHFRAGDGSIGAAITDDVILYPGHVYRFYVEAGRTHFRALRAGGTNAIISYAPVG